MSKNKLGTEENPITLSEVTVTPKAWQIDFHNNFGDSEVRKNVLKSIITDYGRHTANNSINRLRIANTLYNINPYVQRLHEVWNESGRPKITNKSGVINLFGKNRPNYNPINNKIYNANTVRDIIAELSHPIQQKYGERGVLKTLLDVPETIWNEIRGKQNHYDNPNHYEYETHSVIEPELRDYIYKNKQTKYIPKRRSLED